jgi:asparagine synthase (glutamine-hydrolysing)
MCGIAGTVSGRSKDGMLTAMTDVLVHRGPDGEGQWINPDRTVGLGHRRLSIIDLSDDGNQPMHYSDGRYTITFNGEIYNYIELKAGLLGRGYSFKSTSDTEVLLALFDAERENCLSMLDGMFSFAIWDEKEQRLFCARDRFGEKPFYYALYEGGLFFASEMKALWAAGVPRRVNGNLVFNYIAHGYTYNPEDASETFFENIYKLPAAHFFTVSPGQINPAPTRYWDIDYKRVDFDVDEKAVTERFRELFLTSVSRRLRSDVPVGSSLSGGLDSSLVVCAIDRLNQGNSIDQNTFSARFPGFAKDEGTYMDLIINRTRVTPHFVYPNEDGLIRDLENLVYHQEEPFGSASIYAQYCVMRSAKENKTTVLIDGQGADEVLAGYHFYFADYFRELKVNEREKWRSELAAYRQVHADNVINPIAKTSIMKQVASVLPRKLENNLRRANFSLRNSLQPLFHREFFGEYSRNSFYSDVKKSSSLSESLYRSTHEGGLEELLRYSDRNSMAHSREVRLPFLSHELVEFVFSLPAHYKIRNGVTKYIMRRSFADLLPAEILDRKDKIGYEPPQANWLADPSIFARLQESRNRLQKEKILSPRFTIKSDPAQTDSTLAWKLLMVGLLTEK